MRPMRPFNFNTAAELFPAAIRNNDFLRPNFFNLRLKQRLNLLRLDPILDIWPHPILDRRPKLRIAMH